MLCSISGVVPAEPVCLRGSGQVFERRLIVAHLAAHGTDPVTGAAASAADLLELKGTLVARPRSVATASVAGLLAGLQGEWDGLMLEQFALRQTLEATRMELSQSLYQHDAACRVIARLVKERDAARASLTGAQSLLAQRAGAASAAAAAAAASSTSSSSSSSSSSSAADGDQDMSSAGSGVRAGPGMDADAGGIPEDVLAAVRDKHKELTKMRKGRSKVAPVGHASAEELRTGLAVAASSFHPHSPSSPAITCLEAHPDAAARPNVVITGGQDKCALVFDVTRGEVLARLGGAAAGTAAHTKRVSAAAFHPSRDVCFTAGADGHVKVWAPTAAASGAAGAGGFASSYGVAASLRPHSGGRSEVVGLCVHPLGDFALTAGREDWAFCDVAAGLVLSVVAAKPAAADAAAEVFNCARLHPDGLLAAIGTSDRRVRIFDLRTSENAATFERAEEGGVACLAFSENGFTLAWGGTDGTASLWDLRKLACVRTLQLPSGRGAACSALAFDGAGLFLACGTAGGAVALYDAKAAGLAAPAAADAAAVEQLLVHAPFAPHAGAVTGLAWGPQARSLVSCGVDRLLAVHRVQ